MMKCLKNLGGAPEGAEITTQIPVLGKIMFRKKWKVWWEDFRECSHSDQNQINMRSEKEVFKRLTDEKEVDIKRCRACLRET